MLKDTVLFPANNSSDNALGLAYLPLLTGGTMKLKPIKVSVLNQYIKVLMSNSILNNLRVEGEITNIRISKTAILIFHYAMKYPVYLVLLFLPTQFQKTGTK